MIRQKCKTITETFPKALKESNRKSNKYWVNERSKFYNRSIKSYVKEYRNSFNA